VIFAPTDFQDVPTAAFDALFATFAALLGATVGSFLNVCIYRMPRGMSVSKPARSFCPSCEYQIPWYHNIPLVSWLVLRGKCANCGARIAFRYFGVEALTALFFLAIWLHVWPDRWALAFPYWVMASLFIVATFIDFEHFIIPDEITWGGAVAGILLSMAIPLMHGDSDQSRLVSGGWALVGAVSGYAILWTVVELGKKAFGKKRLQFEKPEPFTWTRHGQDADLEVGAEKMLWSDFFARGNEKVLMTVNWIQIGEDRFEKQAVWWSLDFLHVGERQWKLEETDLITGEVTEVTFPREAMGMGDVKFLAAIGAFLGWKAVLFTVVSSSLIGAVVGVVAIALRRREWSAKLPFGPYLALGATIWLFEGPQLVEWYWRFALGKPQ
jgi:leader peptidase (prepilin peptidase) / N-methyltransferase